MKEDYKFELRDATWFKRRVPNPKEPKAIAATVIDFQLIKHHLCKMEVTYDNGDVKTFQAQVTQNHITKKWSVSCGYAMVDVIEPNND